MGTLVVEKGRIDIHLDYIQRFITEDATAIFLADEIGLAIKACYKSDNDAFDNF